MSRIAVRKAVRTAGAIAALALLSVPATASASGTLDQRQESVNVTVTSISVSLAQTFTAGLTGKLSQLELFSGSNAGPLEIQIRNVEATGAPGTEVLASQTLPASSLLEWHTIAFSSPTQVVSGTQYAIVVYQSPHTGSFSWAAEVGNPYAQGASWENENEPPSGPWKEGTLFSGDDFAFKTFVQQPPTTKDQCKDGGWMNFGAMFKNQGQCVSFVAEQQA